MSRVANPWQRLRRAGVFQVVGLMPIMLQLSCGSTPALVEIPPIDQEEQIEDLDVGVEQPAEAWMPPLAGGDVRLGAKTLAEGASVSFEGSPCEEVVVFVASGRVQDGGAVRTPGILLRTQDMISLVALEESELIVSLNGNGDAECEATDDVTVRRGGALENAGGKLHVYILLDAASGGRFGSFAILDGEADLDVPVHTHESSAENLLIASGDGTMIRGEERFALEPGMVVHVPIGVPHGYEPGTTPLVAYQVYAPPGPEQRFRSAPAQAAE